MSPSCPWASRVGILNGLLARGIGVRELSLNFLCTRGSPRTVLRRIRTTGGLELTMSEAETDDDGELYLRFGEIVAAGEGYPQARGALAVGNVFVGYQAQCTSNGQGFGGGVISVV